MKTPASFLKHPLHPMLIVFPLGLWVFSLICDLIYRTPWGGPVWLTVALYTLVGGIVGALAAAIPGFIDYLSIRDRSRRIKGIGAAHMAVNLIVVLLYVVNASIRILENPASNAAFILSVVAAGLLVIGGWLGAEMVYVDRVGVKTDEDEKERGEGEERKRAA